MRAWRRSAREAAIDNLALGEAPEEEEGEEEGGGAVGRAAGVLPRAIITLEGVTTVTAGSPPVVVARRPDLPGGVSISSMSW